jgi:SAM-dependent methyltransferase
MTLRDGTALTTEDVEILNAHGPYSMAMWSSGDISVGNEEGLKGRSAYFTKVLRKALLEAFSLEELRTFSILDVGCNDGWVLHELSDLPFAKMVGVEPREKNIQKGRVVRQRLKLENRVEYRCGSIESLSGEVFDIVLCNGLLYHVESIPLALRQLRNCCRRFLFIESRCLSSDFLTSELRDQIEMRDLVYQFKKPIYGITAQKFESAYHDGSARETTIVNIPTTESLLMNLEILGFEDLKVVADPKTYREAVWKNRRPLDGVCITARLKSADAAQSFDEKGWIEAYEVGLRKNVLPRDLVQSLYEYFVQKKFSFGLSPGRIIPLLYIISPDWLSRIFARWLSRCVRNSVELEIVKNLRYSPEDKISLEFAKSLKAEGKLPEALSVLRQVSTKLNADWRSVYRSFFLISEILRATNQLAEAERYLNLCLTCNPKYPARQDSRAQ